MLYIPPFEILFLIVFYMSLKPQKNLISVHKLAADNNVFLEFHPDFFLVKDQASKKTLLQGRCRRGLYPLPAVSPQSQKLACAAAKPSSTIWHSRLGHPSFSIVHQVISKNNLPCASESNRVSVCDACQQGKSHQLPYPISTSISIVPLQLVFSDVWGPASQSVGKK